MSQSDKYKINIINNNYDTGRSEKLRGYVQGIADKYKFNIDVEVVQHKDLNMEIKKENGLSGDNIADGYIGSGGTGHWKPTGDVHEATGHKVMERSNKVYEHLVSEGKQVHGICEGFTALAQTKGAYAVNSGKKNVNMPKGINHKYMLPADYSKQLGNAQISQNEHEGAKYITEFEKGNISGTQHHPELRQNTQDEQTMVGFMQKVTGQKASKLEKKIDTATQEMKKAA